MMPSKSTKQHNFMAAIAHSPSFAKKVGIPQSVGKDFNEADKGRKFSKGGDTMASKMNPGFMAMMAKKKGMQEGSKADMASDKKQMMGMKKGGMAKDDAKEDMKMDKSQDKAMIKKAFKQHDAQEHKGGKGTALKLSHGGTFRKSANGVAQRGLTKGTQVTMKKGGMC
jgi:hypothetical protein